MISNERMTNRPGFQNSVRDALQHGSPADAAEICPQAVRTLASLRTLLNVVLIALAVIHDEVLPAQPRLEEPGSEYP